MRYVALLRAINVGGRTVTMERLRTLFAAIGFADAHTYIQTGNVFFSSDDSDRAGLTRRIETQLAASLGYEVPVFIRTMDELGEIVRSPVFRQRPPAENERYCVMFTSAPAPANFAGVHTKAADFDVVAVTPGELFLVWHLAKGQVGNPGALVERTLGVKTTTRFFHTLEKMYAAGLAGPAPRQGRKRR